MDCVLIPYGPADHCPACNKWQQTQIQATINWAENNLTGKRLNDSLASIGTSTARP